MSQLTVELCPETSICSLVKPEAKTDLMPHEVADIRAGGGDLERVRSVIAAADAAFASGLDEAELKQIAARLG
jgi:hypothetical protein